MACDDARVSAVLTLVLAGVLVLGAWSGPVVLGVAIGLVQLFWLVGWWSLVGAPSAPTGLALGMAGAVAADLVLLVSPPRARTHRLLAVLTVGVVLTLGAQLVRRPDRRAGVAVTVGATVGGLVLAVLMSLLLAGLAGRAGVPTVLAVVAGAVLGSASLRLPVPLPVRPVVAGILGALVGSAVGEWAHRGGGDLGAGNGAWLGGVAALLAAAGAAVVLAGLAGRDPRRDARAAAAALLAGGALPLVMAAPVAYVLGRILVG